MNVKSASQTGAPASGIVLSMATFALMVVITVSPVMGWIETRLFPEAGVL